MDDGKQKPKGKPTDGSLLCSFAANHFDFEPTAGKSVFINHKLTRELMLVFNSFLSLFSGLPWGKILFLIILSDIQCQVRETFFWATKAKTESESVTTHGHYEFSSCVSISKYPDRYTRGVHKFKVIEINTTLSHKLSNNCTLPWISV